MRSRKQVRNWIWIIAATLLLAGIVLFFIFRPFPLIPVAREKVELSKVGPAFLRADHEAWADALLEKLSDEELYLQLIWVEHSMQQPLRDAWKWGGIIPLDYQPYTSTLRLNEWRDSATVQPFIFGSSSLGLTSGDSLPQIPQASIFQVEQDSVLLKIAAYQAAVVKLCGFSGLMGPPLDLLNDSKDPAGSPDYEAFAAAVTKRTLQWVRLFEDSTLWAVPGNFSVLLPDSILLSGFEKIQDSLYRTVYQQLADSGLAAYTFRPSITNDREKSYLNVRAGFAGLWIGDTRDTALYSDPVIAAVKAFEAGADIILVNSSVTEVPNLLKALKKSSVPKNEMRKRVKRVLMAKAWTGLTEKQLPDPQKVAQYFKDPYAWLASRRLFEETLTIVADINEILPLKHLERRYFGHVSLASAPHTSLNKQLNFYQDFPSYVVTSGKDSNYYQAKIKEFEKFNTLVLSVDPALYSLQDTALQDFLQKLRVKRDLILVWLGGQETLGTLDWAPCLVATGGTGEIPEKLAAEAIFGGFSVHGRLYATLSEVFCAGMGTTLKKCRLSYTVPEDAGIASENLLAIDTIAFSGVNNRAYPGCQVFVAYRGKVIWNRAYGYHTYAREQPVKITDIYDVASVTKVCATTVAAMKLYEEGKLNIDTTLSAYLPGLEDSELKDVKIRDVLIHKAGFPAVPPIFNYIRAMQKFVFQKPAPPNPKTLDDTLHLFAFKEVMDKEYPLKIAEGIYLRNDIPDSIWLKVTRTKLNLPAEFKYSDMSMYIMMRVIESITKMPLDEYVYKNIYVPLGLKTTGYKPAERFILDRIPPTENEEVFRRQQLHGYVHDPIAALLGGVSGHAGLFSSANDLGTLLQMVLNGGNYGGRNYFSRETTQRWTASQMGSHRGLGWDHQYSSGSPSMAASASIQTYGHLGFTGCAVWVDPLNELVYVFLSNRVYPVAENPRILGMNIRPRIHQVVYDALQKAKEKESPWEHILF